jgi:AAA+ ATPase superfamily predicted ATPase
LANLTKVDEASKFETVFDEFYDIVNGDALVPACHVAYVSHKIVKAKPELADKITERLLNLDNAAYKHKELVQANALRSFSQYFDRISDKDKIVSLAKDLQKSKSSRAKKEAAEFLEKWSKN